MLSWKRLLLGTTLPLMVYLYSPIKEHVVDRYAIRWYVQQNSSDRSVRIRIHNLSSNISLPITIEVESPGAKVIDFDYADPWNGPQICSLGTARRSQILRQFDLSTKSPILLDEHLVTSTLEDIEDQLEDAVLVRTVPRNRRKQIGKEDMTFQNHLLWLEQCRTQSPAAYPCYMERAWENWASVITSKPANGDQVKTGQRERPGQNLFYSAEFFGGKLVFVRQLRGPHLSTCP